MSFMLWTRVAAIVFAFDAATAQQSCMKISVCL
jgi:hypothetical protein